MRLRAVSVAALACIVLLQHIAGCRRGAAPQDPANQRATPARSLAVRFSGGAAQLPDEALLNTSFAAHVRDGLVDYRAIGRDSQWWSYLRQLAQVNPDAIESKQSRLALLLNAYNCFVIEGVVENWPIRSVQDVTGFFSSPAHTLGGAAVSLDDIEALARGAGDPRVHCAMARGAEGSPTLRQEAYVGANLDAQLEADCQEVVNSQRWVKADLERRTLCLSELFRGYAQDLEGKPPSPNDAMLDFIYDRLASPRDRDLLTLDNLTIEYMPFDWSLNVGSFPPTPTPTPGGSASGSSDSRNHF